MTDLSAENASPPRFCGACGGPVQLPDLAVCTACLSVRRGSDDALLFIRRTSTREERRLVRQQLNTLFAEGTKLVPDDALVRGDRALLRVTGHAARGVSSAAAAQGIPLRVVPAGRAWTAMPAHFFVLVIAILGAGAAAGIITAPLMLITSPLLAVTLLLAAQTALSRPAVAATSRRAPVALQRAIDTLATLPPGETRGLLGDLVALAAPVVLVEEPAIRRTATELLDAAAATAAEVERFTTLAMTLQPERAGLSSFDVRAVAATCDRVRRTGTERLEEAVDVLSQLVNTSLQDDAGDRLARLTSELALEAFVRDQAAESVRQLLAARTDPAQPIGLP